MTGFLDLPLELRNHAYELLLGEELEHYFCGVMVVSENYVRTIYHFIVTAAFCAYADKYWELKQVVQHEPQVEHHNHNQ